MTRSATDNWNAGFLLNMRAVKAMKNLRARMTSIQNHLSGRKW